VKKSHGPAFRKQLIELSACPTCRGSGFTKGLFHQLECSHCHASGWVAAESGEPLSLPDLVLQLGLRLKAADQMIASLRRPAGGADQQYMQNNRRGAGGSNHTGD